MYVDNVNKGRQFIDTDKHGYKLHLGVLQLQSVNLFKHSNEIPTKFTWKYLKLCFGWLGCS